MQIEKLMSNEKFQKLLLKIFNTIETKKSFEFTYEDALIWSNMGNAQIQSLAEKPKLELDEFPDLIGTESTGENLPENFPVNLPQPVLMEQPVIAKPIVTYLKAKTLELLAENVNQFNKSESIRILYAAPFQQVGNEFVKEIVYYDFES